MTISCYLSMNLIEMDKFSFFLKSNSCWPPDTSSKVDIISDFSGKRWKDSLCHTSTHGLLFYNWSGEIHDSVYDIIQLTYADSTYVKHWLFFVFVIWQSVSSWILEAYLPSWKISSTLYTILGTFFSHSSISF